MGEVKFTAPSTDKSNDRAQIVFIILNKLSTFTCTVGRAKFVNFRVRNLVCHQIFSRKTLKLCLAAESFVRNVQLTYKSFRRIL